MTPLALLHTYLIESKTNGIGKPVDSPWYRMWHYHNYNSSNFMEHYQRRSNAETTRSMTKAKFGGSVRSWIPVAQVNEVLVKFLCHNIRVVIRSIQGLGIEPEFD